MRFAPNTRRYAMANSCNAMHFCAMFGHELSEHQLVEQAQWFVAKDGYMQSHYPEMICPFDSAKLAEGKLVTNREKFGGHALQSADKFISVIDLCASGYVFPRSFGPGTIGASAVMTELGPIVKEMEGTKRDCQCTTITKVLLSVSIANEETALRRIDELGRLHLPRTYTCIK